MNLTAAAQHKNNMRIFHIMRSNKYVPVLCVVFRRFSPLGDVVFNLLIEVYELNPILILCIYCMTECMLMMRQLLHAECDIFLVFLLPTDSIF